MKLLIMLVGLYLLFNCSDSNRDIEKKFRTKDGDRCKLTIRSSDYSTDSLLLTKTFRVYVTAKMGPFNAPAYGEQTIVFIDTIIYNSDLKYCAVLAIEKCSDNKYDGGVHFALRDTSEDSVKFKIFSSHFARHINAENFKEMSDILRMNNFIGLSYEAYIKKEAGFNLDDCRFWTGDYFLNNIKTSYFEDLE